MKKYLLLLFLLTFLCSCNHLKTPDNSIEKVNVILDQVQNKSIYKLFTNVRLIKLETNKKSMFGEIGKLIIHKNNIYILDKKATKSIFVFNIDGKFKYKISRTGKGPGEYIEPVDINIDSQNDHLYVLDRLLNTILIYSLTGDFIEEKKLSFRLLNFQLFSSGDIVGLKELLGGKGSNKNDNKLVHFSFRKNKILNEYFIAPITNDGNLKFDNVFSSYDNNVLYWEIFNNIIYDITDNNISKKYIVDFGNLNIDKKVLSMPLIERLSILNKNGKLYAGLIDNVIMGKNQLYFSFLYNGKSYNVIYNKHSKKSSVYQLTDEVNKINISKIFSKTNNFYVSIVKFNDIAKGSNLLNELDNPMLFICN